MCINKSEGVAPERDGDEIRLKLVSNARRYVIVVLLYAAPMGRDRDFKRFVVAECLNGQG